MKVLVTGSNGQIGSTIKRFSSHFVNNKIYFVDKASLNFCKKDNIYSFFKENKFDLIINCAGYTNVDDAETNILEAETSNSQSLEWIYEANKNNDIHFIHLSTSYVFNGNKKNPYTEDDLTDPLSTYGKSKLSGENVVKNCFKKFNIIRTTWLYSEYGNNFLNKIVNVSQGKKEIAVIDDQFGSPTYTPDIAKSILQVIDNRKNLNKLIENPILHYANKEVVSRYSFVKKTLDLISSECNVSPISTKDYSGKILAVRPANSALSTKKFEKIFEIEVPSWQESLKKCTTNSPWSSK